MSNCPRSYLVVALRLNGLGALFMLEGVQLLLETRQFLLMALITYAKRKILSQEGWRRRTQMEGGVIRRDDALEQP